MSFHWEAILLIIGALIPGMLVGRYLHRKQGANFWRSSLLITVLLVLFLFLTIMMPMMLAELPDHYDRYFHR